MLSDNVPETVKVPALIVVAPEYVLVPLKVWVPDPAFVNPPEPLITPDKVLLLLSPAVKVCELAISILPAPPTEAIVSLASTSYTAPDATVTAVLSDNVPETVKVPEFIVVAPA